jgi:hypothetical protein
MSKCFPWQSSRNSVSFSTLAHLLIEFQMRQPSVLTAETRYRILLPLRAHCTRFRLAAKQSATRAILYLLSAILYHPFSHHTLTIRIRRDLEKKYAEFKKSFQIPRAFPDFAQNSREARASFSFPGSAWERAVRQAPPAATHLRSLLQQIEAEPRRQCGPKRSLGPSSQFRWDDLLRSSGFVDELRSSSYIL